MKCYVNCSKCGAWISIKSRYETVDVYELLVGYLRKNADSICEAWFFPFFRTINRGARRFQRRQMNG